MSEWDNISNYEGWKNKLTELLKEAEVVAQQTDLPTRLAVNDRLTQFILNSFPNTPEIIALDALAEQARTGLMRSTIENRLEALTARTGELARLTKEFQARAAANESSAASIRLERANKVVDSLTSTVRALKDLRSALDTGTEKDLGKSIDGMVLSLQELRSKVEKAA